MFFALGFFSAGLFTLFVANAVWRRAVRLTTKRVQSALPVSLVEIKADRDQLRAEFAMSARKLEMSVEQLKARGQHQLIDITRKNDQLRVLLDEVKKRTETIHVMEEREQKIRSECMSAETAYAETSRTLKLAEEKLLAAQEKLTARERELAQSQTLAHGRQVEIAALQTNLAHFENVVADTNRQLGESQSAFTAKQALLSQAANDLETAHSYRGDIESQINRAWRDLRDQSEQLGLAQETLAQDGDALTLLIGEAKRLAARVQELLRDREIADTVMANRLGVAETRHDLLSKDFENFRAEKAALEVRLGVVQAERQEIAERLHLLESGAEHNWERERMENAMLRERMNDLAAEITALSTTLEGEASPIRRMIATTHAELQADAVSRPASAPFAPEEQGQLSLAERVRVLQARAANKQ